MTDKEKFIKLSAMVVAYFVALDAKTDFLERACHEGDMGVNVALRFEGLNKSVVDVRKEITTFIQKNL